MVRIIEILQFYNSEYSDKNQVTGKQEFSPKNESFMYSAGFH